MDPDKRAKLVAMEIEETPPPQPPAPPAKPLPPRALAFLDGPTDEHRVAGLRHRQQTRLKKTRGTVDAKPAVINTHRLSQPRLAGGHSSLPFKRPSDFRQLRQIPTAR